MTKGQQQKLADLQANFAYLVTRYSMISTLKLQHCPSCAAANVVHLLTELLNHPEVQTNNVLRSTYSGFRTDWISLVQHHQHQHGTQYQEQKAQPNMPSSVVLH